MTEHDMTLGGGEGLLRRGDPGGARDLATKACCCNEAIPPRHQAILAEIDKEILDRFYGCGSPIPPCLEGCTVLDLGCGAGRDAYLASRLVGPRGPRHRRRRDRRAIGGGAPPSGGAGQALRLRALQRRLPRGPV